MQETVNSITSYNQKKDKYSILFISDSSISNPILHSQGFPYLNYVTGLGYQSLVFSREKPSENLKLQEEIKSIKNRFNKIHFIHSYGKHYKKAGWLFNLYADIKVINRILSSEKVNIIHCRSLVPGLLGLYFKIKTLGRIKLIYDNRGLFIDEEIESGHWKNGSIKVRFLKLLEKKLLKYSDSIVVVSEHFESYLLKKYPKISLEKKTITIPNRTKLNRKLTLSLIERNNVNPICVYNGSSAKWQSHREFEKIINAAYNVFKEINFLILTYHIEEFEKTMSQKNILNGKVILKRVPQDKVFEHLLNCNFGLLIRKNNLINNVSSPLKFAEYLSAGLPVLVSEGVGDTEKLIQENNVGVIIRNNNYLKALGEMKMLLEDPEIYERCRNLAEKEFDLNTSFEQYLKIYQDLIRL